MIYLPQETIVSLVKQASLPIVINPCPASENTQRQKMQALVTTLSQNYPDIRDKFLVAFQNIGFGDIWKQRQPIDLNTLLQI